MSSIREQVREVFSRVATDPANDPPIPVGRALAEGLGYPRELLDRIPAPIVERFAGVSKIGLSAVVEPTYRVLDLGCGAGMDTRVLAERAREVVGLDFSAQMLEVARTGGLPTNVRLVQGDAEGLPFPEGSFDVVVANGIFNLNPDRDRIFDEILRVLRPGGQFFGAELILAPGAEVESNPANWFG